MAEDHGLLYDVLIMDHPSVSAFNQLQSRLHRFQVAVLPVVMAMSNADAELIARWVRAGGTLVAVDWNHTAMFDEDYRSRPPCSSVGAGSSDCCSRSTVLQSLLQRPGKGAVRLLSAQLHRYAFKGFHDADDVAIAAAMTPPATSAARPQILQSEQLPKTVWRNVWVHAGGPMRSVALVNYDGNASTNELRPVASPFSITLRCCDDDIAWDLPSTDVHLGCDDISNASITTSGAKSSTVVLPLTVTKISGVTCTLLHTSVPGGTIHSALGVIVFSVCGEHRLRAAAAVARRELERLRIATRTEGIPAGNRAMFMAEVAAAGVALRKVQQGPLRAAVLADGVSEYAKLELNLSLAVFDIGLSTTKTAALGQLLTLNASSSSLLALAAIPPSTGTWQTLSPSQAFNASLGFGWVDGDGGVLVSSPDGMRARDDGSTDGLHGAYICSADNKVRTLRIEIPDASDSGVVTIVSGSYDESRQTATTALRVEGAVTGGALQLPGGYGFSGKYRHPSFRFDCASGNRSLFVSLFSDTSGNFYGDGYSQGTHSHTFVLNGLLIRSGRHAATTEGQAYLTLAEGLATTQLLHFMFVGPFDDPHFTSRGRVLGPEASTNYSDSYDDGVGHQLRWQTLEVQSALAAPMVVRMPKAAAQASCNRTVAVFLCTHVYVPHDSSELVVAGTVNARSPSLEVELTGSTTALAEVYLNGELVLNDRLVTGHLLREFNRTLSLPRGKWNELKVKAMQMSWASEPWGMTMSLHQVGSAVAVPGLRSRF